MDGSRDRGNTVCEDCRRIQEAKEQLVQSGLRGIDSRQANGKDVPDC